MTTFKVFHAKEITDAQGRVTGIKGRFGFARSIFPDDFRHVATVTAASKGEVFQLTNTIDYPWPENAGVTIATGVDPNRLRSTSVGDVIEDGTTFFAVAPTGFLALAPLDEVFTTWVPMLYTTAVQG